MNALEALQAIADTDPLEAILNPQRLRKIAADALTAQPAASRVFLVVTGETVDGQETYTRHEGAPPRLCDFETLYTAAQPARAGGDAQDAARYRWLRSTTNSFTNSRGEKIDVKLSPAEFDAAVDAALAAAPAPVRAGGDDLRECMAADSNYAAGMLLGWNLCVAGEEAAFHRLRESRMRDVAQARAALAAAPQPACDVPPEGWTCTRGKGHEGPCAAAQEEVAPEMPVSVDWVAKFPKAAAYLIRRLAVRVDELEAAPQPAAAEHVVDANKMVRPDHFVDLNKMFPPDFNALIGWLADEAHAAIRAAYPAVRTESLDRAVQSYFEAMQPAASTVPATSNLVPGQMRCARCKFQLTRSVLYMGSGTVGAGDLKTEPCPNGCGPLWPVTWEEAARDAWAAGEQMFERAKAAEDKLAAISGPRLVDSDAAPAAVEREAGHIDTQRLDYLQSSGATVELLPGAEASPPMRFRVGGLHKAVHENIRCAIDSAIELRGIGSSKEGGDGV